MWMMGYNDSGHEFNTEDFHGRKLRPLIPRPVVPSTNTNSSARINGGTDFNFAHNHHLATMGDQSKGLDQFNAQQVVVSTRWNPTPEQLRTLEDLYRRGTRTPSAEQIQHITAQLRRYGKIEGKNVFYWFQNHKARERQKRRRQTESGTGEQPNRDIEALETTNYGANGKNHVVEQSKNWTPSTDCSTLPEQSISIQRAAKATSMAESCRPVDLHGVWIQFDGEDQLEQQRKNFITMERNTTWQMMQLSCSATHHLINTTSTAPPTTTLPNTNTTVSTVLAPEILSRMDQKYLFKSHDQLNIFNAEHDLNSRRACNEEEEEEEEGFGESQTLELFPLHSSNNGDNMTKERESTHEQELAMNANLTSYQFFEFLPLKN